MLVMFAAGVASLIWMALLTALMVHEKTRPAGRRAVPVTGVALLALRPSCCSTRASPPARSRFYGARSNSKVAPPIWIVAPTASQPALRRMLTRRPPDMSTGGANS